MHFQMLTSAVKVNPELGYIAELITQALANTHNALEEQQWH